MMWAAVKAQAFEGGQAIMRLGRSALRRAAALTSSRPPPPVEERLSWYLKQMSPPPRKVADDRPTAVDVRRAV